MIKRILKKINARRPVQTTFVYCECDNELIGSDCFVFDTYIDGRNIVHFKCNKCGVKSFFDFDYPAPVALKDDDIIIKKYKNSKNKKS